MRGRKNKRILAILAAVVMMISTCLSGIPTVTVQAAAYTVLETDVSEASSGCTMFGVLGTYYVDAQTALDRINEIRKEACEAGNVPDPRNKSRMLTSSDYVPIKWSTDLERVARIRAMEGGLCYGFMGSGHNRLNGKEWSSVSYNSTSSYTENLAYNYDKGDLVSGINQWYGEKTYWVNQTSGKVTGHYSSMINPSYKYVGLGDFYTTASTWPNTLAGEFSYSSSSTSTYLDGYADIMQKIEVLDSYISGYELEGEDAQYIGDTQTLVPRVVLKNSSESTELTLWVIDDVTYTSSNSAVATVTSTGVVTAKKAGTVTITAKSNGKTLATKTITVSCNHNYVLQSTVSSTCTKEGTKTYKCSSCGAIKTELMEKAAHAYVYGTAGSDGTATGTCSVCGDTITITPPTAYTLLWNNGVSSDGYYHYVYNVPSAGDISIGSTIKCLVYSMTGGDNDYTDIVFESSDDSILSAPEGGYSLGKTAAFTVKKAGIVTVTAYPKYNSSLKKTYTIRTGTTGSASIKDADVKLSASSASCSANTTTLSKNIVPTVTVNGVTLEKGTDYTVSYAKTDTNTGTCTITGKGVFKDSTEVTYNLTHTYTAKTVSDDTLKKAATCTSPAIYYYSCANCGVVDKSSDAETFTSGSAIAHTYMNIVKAAALKSVATCNDPATYYKSCKNCGELSDETFTNGFANGHSFTLASETAATCVSKGVKTYKCTACDYSYKETTPTTSHVYTRKSVRSEALNSAADCMGPATYKYSCEYCDAVNYAANAETFTYGEKGDHKYEVTSEKATTCTEDGTRTYTCTVCGDTYSVTLDKIAHDFTKRDATDSALKSAANCTDPAEYYYSCSVCGAIDKSENAKTFTNGKANGHDYKAEVTTAATCTKEGVKTYTCSVCDDTYTETLPKIAHDYTAKTVKEETLKSESDCVNPARYYYSCSVCGDVNDAEDAETFTYGTATTHNYNTKRTDDKYLCTEATCTQPATYYYSCSGCGEIESTNPETFESGESIGHDYKIVSETAATCTAQGSKTYACSACGDTYSETIAKTAHNYTAKNTASAYLKSAATTSSPAVYYYSCSVCGAKGTATFTSGSALANNTGTSGSTTANNTGTSGSGSTTAKGITVSYKTHIQTYGDTQSVKTNGQMAGTSGESKRLENIWIKVSGDSNLGIQYTTHCQTYGWLPWSANGEANGTSGESKRLEAIKIRLTGSDAGLYDVYYRVHAQSFGWLAWAKNGEPSGTAGYAKRLEGIQIVVVKKGAAAPGLNYAGVNASQTAHDTRAYVSQSNTAIVIPGSDSTVNVMYKTHVQSYGWQTWKENGEMSGTSGKAKRLEGINIKLSNAPYSGGIRYTTHVQTYGWQGNENNPTTWKQDGAMAGTSGEAKRLEAIRIALYGEMAEHYDVYYRVHAQTYGWLGWAKNGTASGTAGYAKRLEGIQIVLVPKGQAAPSNTYMGITSTNALPYISK